LLWYLPSVTAVPPIAVLKRICGKNLNADDIRQQLLLTSGRWSVKFTPSIAILQAAENFFSARWVQFLDLP
jgi:hypothetical protein